MGYQSRPYYAKHQILTGQYTSGDEFVFKDGTDYIGAFHVLPNGNFFTDFSPKENSKQLFRKRIDTDKNIQTYNRVGSVKASNYVAPVPYFPRPGNEDYQFGFIERYFVQRRNNPLISIIEIDVDQYNTTNKKNKPGINNVLWNKTLIIWTIAGPELDVINRRRIIELEPDFPGLGIYLNNLFEFSK